MVNKDEHAYTVFQKSDAKIQITMTMVHLSELIILVAFSYRLSVTNVANFNKSTTWFLSNSFLKMELKNRIFQYGKYRLAYLMQQVLRMT